MWLIYDQKILEGTILSRHFFCLLQRVFFALSFFMIEIFFTQIYWHPAIIPPHRYVY